MNLKNKLQSMADSSPIGAALFRYMRARQRATDSSQLNTIWHSIKKEPGVTESQREQLQTLFNTLEELGAGVAERSVTGRIIAFKWGILPQELAAAVSTSAQERGSGGDRRREPTYGRRSSDSFTSPDSSPRAFHFILSGGRRATLNMPERMTPEEKAEILRVVGEIPTAVEGEVLPKKG